LPCTQSAAPSRGCKISASFSANTRFIDAKAFLAHVGSTGFLKTSRIPQCQGRAVGDLGTLCQPARSA
jgi:hypothetical protein